MVECYEWVSTVQSWRGPWAVEGSQVLKRVIGRLSAALSVKIITWNEHSDRSTYCGVVLICNFPLVIGEGPSEKGKNLRDLPKLNQEAQGFLLPQMIVLEMHELCKQSTTLFYQLHAPIYKKPFH